MSSYQKILSVIDPTTEEQKSLARALELACKTHGSVTAFLSIYDFSYDMTTMLSVEEREMMRQAVVDDRIEWVNSLVSAQANPDNINIIVKVVWHHRAWEAILNNADEGCHDLIVKGTQQHDTLKSVIFTPTDWHLLRKSPISVLLVKDHAWPEGGAILGAVNVGSEDEAHLSLNHKISASCKEMAALLKSHTHLVNSYPGTPINIAIEIPEFDPQSYNTSVKEYHDKCMCEHAAEAGIGQENCHVLEGLPEDVIPALAKELDAELVVLGTVRREGLSAALIGNTAEHVIDMLDCDVLALKPD